MLPDPITAAPATATRRGRAGGTLRLLSVLLGILLVTGWSAPAAGADTSGSEPPVAPSASAAPGTAQTGSADPAPAADRVTWGVEPVPGAEGEPRVSFRHDLDPGGTAADTLVVRNFAEREVTFDLYARDGITTPDGRFDIAQAEVTPTDSGSWIELETTSVTVPAQGVVEVPFRISIPATATPGDHPAGIVATVRTTGGDGEGAAVSVERRVGARVHLRVTGDIAPALEVQQLSTAFTGEWTLVSGGRLRTTFEVANTGNIRLGAQGSITVSGPFGLGSRTVALTPVAEILPGTSVPVDVEIDGVPPLFLAGAEVTLHPVAVAADAAPQAAPAAASLRTAAVPWAWIVVAAVLALIVTNLLMSRSRWRRRLAAAVAAAAPTPPAGDATVEAAPESGTTAPEPASAAPRHR